MPAPAPSPPGTPEPARSCEWRPVGTPAACYAPAGYVLVDRSGGPLPFSCAAYLEPWRERLSVPYRVLTRAEWVASGCGYRGPHPGAAGYERGDAWEPDSG